VGARLARLLLVVLVALACCGCTREHDVVELTRWTLDAPGVHEAVTVPQHFDKELGDRDQHFTLTARVDVPAELRAHPVALAIPYFAGQATLRANGVDVPDSDASPFETYRAVGAHRFLIPADVTRTGSLDLALDVNHRWTQSAWLDTVPRLAGANGGRDYALVATFNQASACAALAMNLLVSIVYALLYLADRRRTEYGWFSLASIAGALYSAYTLGLLEPLFGWGDLALVGFGVTLSSISSIMLTGAIFQHKPSRAWWGLLVLWCIVAAFSFGPFAIVRWASPIAILTMFAAGTFCLRMLVQAMRRGRPTQSAVLATIAWPVVCVLALDDSASWLGFGELYHGFRGACAGTALVAILQAAAVGAQLMQSLREAAARVRELEEQARELGARGREIGQLNEELRHQVAERSRELTEVLAQTEGSVAATALAVGDVFHGRYRVTRPLGRGGMGAVYEVERTRDGKRLALKVVTGVVSAKHAARFAREAEIGARVQHENLVSIVDVGIATGATPFLVMELVQGGTLEDKRMCFGDAVWALPIVRQIAAGLAELHANRVVHRDLKPGNVLLVENGGGSNPLAKISDFGISRFGALDGSADVDANSATVTAGPEHASPRDLTETGAIMGTPVYMPPEAWFGPARHPSADLFSLGVLAYEALTGRSPFAVPAVLLVRARQPIPTPGPLDGVNTRVASVVLACLRVEPSERPRAREVAEVLSLRP